MSRRGAIQAKSGLAEVGIPVNVQVNYDDEKGRVWGDVMRRRRRPVRRRTEGRVVVVAGVAV